MASIVEVAQREIEAIDAAFKQSGRMFPCVDGKRHRWDGGGENPRRLQVCSRCGKRFKYPHHIGSREHDELADQRDRMTNIVEREQEKVNK